MVDALCVTAMVCISCSRIMRPHSVILAHNACRAWLKFFIPFVCLQVGQKGITATFLAACMDLLAKHRFLRVRVGEGGKKQEALAALLAALLDSVCVFQIGSTVTLFRQGGLPRPSNCPQNHDLPPELVSQSPSADAAFGAMGAMKGGKAERRIAQLARRAAGQAAHAARRAPPEFHTA